ncbi:hypothetical protein [Halobaculum magnesiiphilum]|uniref:Uncharacterized protein n=1 Tax=Halobaculum magnesiiphilum TaxID=1017351 RepID=A0A8T8W979_9EURY|nr:hypothetical protein [Halobaculum magnesiiphilum]QZP36388.1 hypothetical protein K6T50_08575 [Halobaculum magnesiiphilum]
MNQFDITDKIATAFGAGLVLLGIVGLGLVELLAGKPYSPVPLTNEAGEVIATPAIDPTLRTGLVLLGLVVLFVWGLYRAATPDAGADRTPTEVTAD